MSGDKTLVVIPARMGSDRFPGKPLALHKMIAKNVDADVPEASPHRGTAEPSTDAVLSDDNLHHVKMGDVFTLAIVLNLTIRRGYNHPVKLFFG